MGWLLGPSTAPNPPEALGRKPLLKFENINSGDKIEILREDGQRARFVRSALRSRRRTPLPTERGRGLRTILPCRWSACCLAPATPSLNRHLSRFVADLSAAARDLWRRMFEHDWYRLVPTPQRNLRTFPNLRCHKVRQSFRGGRAHRPRLNPWVHAASGPRTLGDLSQSRGVRRLLPHACWKNRSGRSGMVANPGPNP